MVTLAMIYPPFKKEQQTMPEHAEIGISDLEVHGNSSTFQLLYETYSRKHRRRETTKAIEIPGVGCVVQVSTHQGGQIAEAVPFVPGVTVVDLPDGGRKLEQDPSTVRPVQWSPEPWIPSKEDLVATSTNTADQPDKPEPVEFE
jgi:hypothetical protein